MSFSGSPTPFQPGDTVREKVDQSDHIVQSVVYAAAGAAAVVYGVNVFNNKVSKWNINVEKAVTDHDIYRIIEGQGISPEAALANRRQLYESIFGPAVFRDGFFNTEGSLVQRTMLEMSAAVNQQTSANISGPTMRLAKALSLGLGYKPSVGELQEMFASTNIFDPTAVATIAKEVHAKLPEPHAARMIRERDKRSTHLLNVGNKAERGAFFTRSTDNALSEVEALTEFALLGDAQITPEMMPAMDEVIKAVFGTALGKEHKLAGTVLESTLLTGSSQTKAYGVLENMLAMHSPKKQISDLGKDTIAALALHLEEQFQKGGDKWGTESESPLLKSFTLSMLRDSALREQLKYAGFTAAGKSSNQSVMFPWLRSARARGTSRQKAEELYAYSRKVNLTAVLKELQQKMKANDPHRAVIRKDYFLNALSDLSDKPIKYKVGDTVGNQFVPEISKAIARGTNGDNNTDYLYLNAQQIKRMMRQARSTGVVDLTEHLGGVPKDSIVESTMANSDGIMMMKSLTMQNLVREDAHSNKTSVFRRQGSDESHASYLFLQGEKQLTELAESGITPDELALYQYEGSMDHFAAEQIKQRLNMAVKNSGLVTVLDAKINRDIARDVKVANKFIDTMGVSKFQGSVESQLVKGFSENRYAVARVLGKNKIIGSMVDTDIREQIRNFRQLVDNPTKALILDIETRKANLIDNDANNIKEITLRRFSDNKILYDYRSKKQGKSWGLDELDKFMGAVDEGEFFGTQSGYDFSQIINVLEDQIAGLEPTHSKAKQAREAINRLKHLQSNNLSDLRLAPQILHDVGLGDTSQQRLSSELLKRSEKHTSRQDTADAIRILKKLLKAHGIKEGADFDRYVEQLGISDKMGIDVIREANLFYFENNTNTRNLGGISKLVGIHNGYDRDGSGRVVATFQSYASRAEAGQVPQLVPLDHQFSVVGNSVEQVMAKFRESTKLHPSEWTKEMHVEHNSLVGERAGRLLRSMSPLSQTFWDETGVYAKPGDAAKYGPMGEHLTRLRSAMFIEGKGKTWLQEELQRGQPIDIQAEINKRIEHIKQQSGFNNWFDSYGDEDREILLRKFEELGRMDAKKYLIGDAEGAAHRSFASTLANSTIYDSMQTALYMGTGKDANIHGYSLFHISLMGNLDQSHYFDAGTKTAGRLGIKLGGARVSLNIPKGEAGLSAVGNLNHKINQLASNVVLELGAGHNHEEAAKLIKDVTGFNDAKIAELQKLSHQFVTLHSTAQDLEAQILTINSGALDQLSMGVENAIVTRADKTEMDFTPLFKLQRDIATHEKMTDAVIEGIRETSSKNPEHAAIHTRLIGALESNSQGQKVTGAKNITEALYEIVKSAASDSDKDAASKIFQQTLETTVSMEKVFQADSELGRQTLARANSLQNRLRTSMGGEKGVGYAIEAAVGAAQELRLNSEVDMTNDEIHRATYTLLERMADAGEGRGLEAGHDHFRETLAGYLNTSHKAAEGSEVATENLHRAGLRAREIFRKPDWEDPFVLQAQVIQARTAAGTPGQEGKSVMEAAHASRLGMDGAMKHAAARLTVPLLAIGGIIGMMAASTPQGPGYSPGERSRHIDDSTDANTIAKYSEIPGSPSPQNVWTGAPAPFQLNISFSGMVKNRQQQDQLSRGVFDVISNHMDIRNTDGEIVDNRTRDRSISSREMLKRIM